MKSWIAAKIHDPTFRFVSTAYLIHIATLMAAFYAGAGMNSLINPLGITMTAMLAGYSASAGPVIHARTGSLRTAIWTTVGVPLALVVVGIPVAVAVNGIGTTPMMRLMLLVPWWILFFVVTIRTASKASGASLSAGHRGEDGLLGIYKEIITGAPRWYGSRGLGAVVIIVTGFVAIITLGAPILILIILMLMSLS